VTPAEVSDANAVLQKHKREQHTIKEAEHDAKASQAREMRECPSASTGDKIKSTLSEFGHRVAAGGHSMAKPS